VRRLIGTSTKMHLTSRETAAWCDALRPLVADLGGVDLFVLPPFTALWTARERLAESTVAWGAQDVAPEDVGAHTGDISAPMLVDLGCTYVEVGHAERRRDHGETNARVAAKVAQILRHAMTPIVCLGEPSKASLADALDVVLGQAAACLADVPPPARADVVLAYEPVWAIGAGAAPASPAHIAGIHAGIHAWLRSPGGGGVDARVIYGGSVDQETAGPILATPGVEGLFVGRAALDPARFAAIARIAAACAADLLVSPAALARP
jgi:triosephosphate isomerase